MELDLMWKNKMKEVIGSIYGNEFASSQDFDNLLNSMIAKARPSFPNLVMRNLYTTKNVTVPLNKIFDVIHDEDLCISGNNTLTYSFNKVKSTIPKLLIKKKADRNFHKKKMLKAKETMAVLKKEGTFKDGCSVAIEFNNENKIQLKVKTFMNSVYGVQGQPGSYLFSPDTAGAVTAEGRNLIAEMTWTMERLLYGTVHFSSVNEMYAYISAVKKSVNKRPEFKSWITYIPTKEDIIQKFSEIGHDTVGFYDGIDSDLGNSVSRSIYYMINNLTEDERIYFYYSNDLFNLISKNYKIFDLFDTMISSPIKYLAPAYKPDDEVCVKYDNILQNIKGFSSTESLDTYIKSIGGKENDVYNFLVYKIFNPILETICDIIEEFVLTNMSTAKRCLKYQTLPRRAIIVSDTDSVIINLHPWVVNLSKLHSIRNNIPYRGEHVGFYDEMLDFKLINIMAYICTFGTKKAGDLLAKNANIPEDLRKWIDMKNEFLFARLVMYSGAKKNYIVHTRLQEGKIIDDCSATGIKLNSSVIHQVIEDKMMKCIEDNMLKSENIDTVKVLCEIKNIERFIIESIKNGDLTFGRKARYSGPNGYKTGVYTNDSGRSAFIWNILYPNLKIEAGSYGYIFPTTLNTEMDVRKKMMDKFPEEANMLLEKIFGNPNLKPYGLRSIMIPINEAVTKLPEWIIPFIEYSKISTKHLAPLITLLPTVGLKNSAISSGKTNYSPLVSFE